MISVAVLLALVNCAEPRMDYRAFFERETLIKFPGQYGEEMSTVQRRALDLLADYATYSEAYRDKCK